jgi:hypothetical protein
MKFPRPTPFHDEAKANLPPEVAAAYDESVQDCYKRTGLTPDEVLCLEKALNRPATLLLAHLAEAKNSGTPVQDLIDNASACVAGSYMAGRSELVAQMRAVLGAAALAHFENALLDVEYTTVTPPIFRANNTSNN